MGNKKKNIFRFLPMDMGRLVCSVLLPYFRMKRIRPDGSKYKEKLKGGAIIAANHTGFSDPFIMGVAFWYRRLFFLAAKEVMINSFIGVLLKGMGCIKIDRDISDINAIRKCVDILKDGKLLGMFPQGGIKRDGEMDKIKSGAVLIALQAGVPIIPMYSADKKHWWSRKTVVIGEPINCRDYCQKKFPSLADMEKLSEILLDRMLECENAVKEK